MSNKEGGKFKRAHRLLERKFEKLNFELFILKKTTGRKLLEINKETKNQYINKERKENRINKYIKCVSWIKVMIFYDSANENK